MFLISHKMLAGVFPGSLFLAAAWQFLKKTQTAGRASCIGVEYCYGANIKADEAYRRYVWVLAYACWKFHLDPARNIIGHHLLDSTRKTDPQSGLVKSGRSYAQLLYDVAVALASYSGKAAVEASVPAPVLAAAPAPATWADGSQAGILTVRARLNLRYGQPSRSAPGRARCPPASSSTTSGGYWATTSTATTTGMPCPTTSTAGAVALAATVEAGH